MRLFLALVAVLLAAVFFAYPPLLEGSDSECGALEQRAADLASHDGFGRLTVGALYGSSSSSPSGAAFVRDRYAALPPAMGCALAYWKMLLAPPAPIPAASAAPAVESAARPPAPSEGEPPPPAPQARGMVSTIARGVTPNGDPISPAAAFTLPMPGVAIRLAYPGANSAAVRFQLRQGRAVLSSCIAQRVPPGAAWCKFDVSLRKGVYSIAAIANHATLGWFPFTVLGN